MRIGLRPWQFWKLKPVELAEIAEAYFERERDKDKQEWRRAAFIASWIINTAGKTYKRDISADKLINFKDEVNKKDITPLSPEEQKRRAQERLQFHKKKFWTLLKTDKDGDIKIFDEEDYKALQEKRKKGH